jgi:hypothetical protein
MAASKATMVCSCVGSALRERELRKITGTAARAALMTIRERLR